MKSLLEKLYFALIFAEITGVTVRLFGGGNADSAAGHTSNPILLLFNVLVVLGTSVYAFPYLPRMWSALLQLKWTFLLYFWMSVSIFWSTLPAASFRAEVYALVYLVSAAFFSVRYSTQEILARLNWCFLAVALLSIPAEFILPPLDDLAPGWSGVFIHKNAMGSCMILAIAVLQVRGKRWTLLRAGSLALYLALLGLSQSFTSVVATAVVMLFIFSQSTTGRIRSVLYITLAGVFCLSLLVSDPVSLLLGAGGKSSNFTGRDAIWAYALAGIARHPLAGYGYGAFWGEATDVEHALHWVTDQAHNGPLQLMLDLGLVGLILTIGMLVNTWRRALRVRRADSSSAGLWTLALLVATLAHTPMEADLMLLNPIWYLVVLAAFSCLRAEREALITASTYRVPRLTGATYKVPATA